MGTAAGWRSLRRLRHPECIEGVICEFDAACRHSGYPGEYCFRLATIVERSDACLLPEVYE